MTDSRSKEKWHYDRAGALKHATMSKGIKHGYEAELQERGVHDEYGQTTPMEKKTVEPKTYRRHTRLLNVGMSDPNIKTGMGVRDDAEIHHGFAFRD